MRIIIEIDGPDVTVTTHGMPSLPEAVDAASATPPPEVLEAAARLGALSAGPAPGRLGSQGVAVAAPASGLVQGAPVDALEGGMAPVGEAGPRLRRGARAPKRAASRKRPG